jgi:HEAT repeat protein
VRNLGNRRAAIQNGLFGRVRPSPRLVIYAISLAGPRAGDEALTTITAGLQMKDWQVRVACCRALGQYGLGLGTPAEADAALDGLINALSDVDPLVREIAAESIQAMGQSAARAVDALIERVERDPHRRVRRQAGLALESVDPSYKGSVPLF